MAHTQATKNIFLEGPVSRMGKCKSKHLVWKA